MTSVREFTNDQQEDPGSGFQPQYGHIGCRVCGMEAQALVPVSAPRVVLSDELAMTNDWEALGEWSLQHATTHSQATHDAQARNT